MPTKMEISETECLKLSKVLDQASIPVKNPRPCARRHSASTRSPARARRPRRASLPKFSQDSCKEYIAKNDKIKDAWAGASQKDRLRRNHTQLQRRLTSSRQ